MPDPRRVPVTHPDVKLLGRIFGFTSRTASSSMTFFLLADAARLDATHSDRDLSHLTPGFVVAAHKLLDDMLNDAIRRALMGSHERSVPTDKRTMAEALLRKSLTSGDPSRPSRISKIDQFMEIFGLDLDPELVLALKRLCDLRDIIFHDETPARTQDIWQSFAFDMARMLRLEGSEVPSREAHFLLWIFLIDFCERTLRRFQKECQPVQACQIFDELGSAREGLPPTCEAVWKERRSRLLVHHP
jgi:hypothetical protein